MFISDKTCSVKGAQCRESINRLQELRETETLVDFSLITSDGQTFPVHKSHLACWSEYAKTMFSGSLKESVENRVELPSLSSAVSLMCAKIYF